MAGPASPRTKQLALITAILASAIAAVDSTAVNVALPAISRDLGGGFAAQQWVSNSYLLTLSALILLAGSLTDRLGERRVFTAGVAGFGIGSALCAASPTIGVLIVARSLQGVSGALLTPAALAIIVSVFPKEERGGAIGTWTAWGGIGILAGPIIGGQIVDSASWRWIFIINVPLVIIALVLSRIAVPGRAHGMPDTRIDWTGAGLAALGLAGISFGLIEQPVLGWSDPGVWGALLAGFALFGAFIWHEAHTRMPMLPLELFRHRNFAVANAQTFVMYGGIGLLGFFVTIYLQQVAGWSALQSGVTGLIPTVVMFFLSGRMGRLADKYGPRPFLTVGPLFVAAGFALMERYGTTVSFLTDVLPALLVFSFGLSLTVAPLTATVLADASEMDAGIASAVNNAIARTGSLVAVAAVGRRRRVVLRRAAQSPPRPSPAGVKPGGAARGRAPDVRQHRRRRGAVAATRLRPPRDRRRRRGGVPRRDGRRHCAAHARGSERPGDPRQAPDRGGRRRLRGRSARRSAAVGGGRPAHRRARGHASRSR